MQKPLHKRRELIITLYVQIQWGEEKKILVGHRGKKYLLSSHSVQQNVHRNPQNLLPNFHISCLCLYFPTHTRELMGKGGGRELVILFHFFFPTPVQPWPLYRKRTAEEQHQEDSLKKKRENRRERRERGEQQQNRGQNVFGFADAIPKNTEK